VPVPQDDTTVREVDGAHVRGARPGELTTYVFYSRRAAAGS